MSDGSVFAAKLHDFAQKTPEEISTFRRAVLIELFSSVVVDTPVGDDHGGRLRGNWQTSIGAPAGATIETVRPPEEVKQNILAVLGATKGKGDVTIYLVNNLPYAYRIEFEGWSHTKAPAGMVRKNVDRLSAIVQKALSEMGKA